MRANLPDRGAFLGRRIPGREDILLPVFIKSGNDGHVFRGRSDELQRDFACKIIPRANLQRHWRAEIEKAHALRNATVVRFSDVREWKDAQAGIDCFVLIADYVDGPNLGEFLSKRASDVTVPLVVQFMEVVLDLFNEMASVSVSHGDFHAGNVLVEERSYALTGPRYAFRVTDFGVASATSEARFKDDYLQLAVVLRQFLAVIDYPSCSPRDKRVFNVLNDEFLARHLTEQDPTRDPLARNPRALFDRLREADTEAGRASGDETARLQTPFDFLSCEQIGDAPILLRALYSDRFLGLREIQGRNNIVVTGPRGCGKSTVFRSLCLRHRLRVDDAAPDTVTEIGVYYRCDDLYFAFPRYEIPERREAWDLPIHFVTATLLSELLESLERWADKYYRQELRQTEGRAAQKLWDVLRLQPPRQPGAETLRAIAVELQKQRRWAAEKQRFVHDPKHPIRECFGAGVLQGACDALAETFPFVATRPFYFLIDDYSSPKVTKPLQENLNRVFMQRAGTCFFKLSTESPVSYARRDIDGKVYVENREYILHNLGLVFLHAEIGLKLDFIQDVFRRRLAAPSVPFPVRELRDLLGSNTALDFNETARQLRDKKKIELWGEEVLCRLCSGDIHYLISLVGDMVNQGGGPQELVRPESLPRIPERIQNKAIRDAAGSFLRNLRSIPQHGERLVAIVTAFGTVAHAYLRHKDSTNETGNPPWQATRIEPYEPFNLSPEAQRIYDELLRYSVFIEDVRGKSRRGKVVPRLYLRRFLIPHFNLTFGMRDSIQLEPADFEQFLVEPTKFENRMRARVIQRPDDGLGPTRDNEAPRQEELEFGVGGEGEL